jgi:hypothetical protein
MQRTARLAAATASGAALAVALGAAGSAIAAPAVANVPNPCTILALPVVSSTVGLGGVTLHGVRSTRPDGRLTQALCTFTHGTAKLEIYVAPHQPSGGSGGPPGMVITKPSGLGVGATFAYDANPHFSFANAFFSKGAFDAGVWDNGKLPNGDILALARSVYKALP